MLPGMFTGYVDEEYVTHRHSIWFKKLQEKRHLRRVVNVKRRSSPTNCRQ